MFTGLVESTGTVASIETKTLTSQTTAKLSISEHHCSDAKHGDSIAINGCCLTVSEVTDKTLSFDISQETLSCTQLGSLSKGEKVNMERSMHLSSRLDGHIVSGHVDGKATVCILEKYDDYWLVGVSIPRANAANVIDKGSICIDGVSLTVNKIIDKQDATIIELMLIPTTIAKTNFAQLKINKDVNIEYDLVGKYIRQAQLSLP